MRPEPIIDRRELLLHNHTIKQVKVQWKHLSMEESTWELESVMHEAYPILFQDIEMEEYSIELVTPRTLLSSKGRCM